MGQPGAGPEYIGGAPAGGQAIACRTADRIKALAGRGEL
jgi:hypothetical protein